MSEKSDRKKEHRSDRTERSERERSEREKERTERSDREKERTERSDREKERHSDRHHRSRSKSPRKKHKSRSHRSRSKSADRKHRSRSNDRRRSKTPPTEAVTTLVRSTISDKVILKPPDLSTLQALINKNPLIGADPQFTRQARRMYVGGLPIGLSFSENQLMEFFVHASKELGILTEVPVVSVWISPDAIFCFVEYRSVIDCTHAISLFQNLTFAGRPLRIGRPADYKPLPSSLSDYIVPIPQSTNSGNTGVTNRFIGTPSSTSLIALSLSAAVAKQSKDDKEANKADAPDVMTPDLVTMLGYANLPTLIYAAQNALLDEAAARVPSMTPTTVICLENMITSDDIQGDEYNEVIMDTEDECSLYGKVLSVIIPKSGPSSTKIFVKFSSKSEASTARIALYGRMIDNRKLEVPFYDEQKFNKYIYA